eukprot:3441256-Amphidinium_carterae.1
MCTYSSAPQACGKASVHAEVKLLDDGRDAAARPVARLRVVLESAQRVHFCMEPAATIGPSNQQPAYHAHAPLGDFKRMSIFMHFFCLDLGTMHRERKQGCTYSIIVCILVVMIVATSTGSGRWP